MGEFHKKIISTLHREFMISIGKIGSPGFSFILNGLFFFILYSNFIGLFPYIFTSISHLTITGGTNSTFVIRIYNLLSSKGDKLFPLPFSTQGDSLPPYAVYSNNRNCQKINSPLNPFCTTSS